MGGIKRSLLAAGLLATTSSAYLFPPPSGAGLSSTSTSRAIADRKSTISSRQASGAPSPRMSTMSPSSEQQQESVATVQAGGAGGAAAAAAAAAAAGELVSSASAAQLASSLIFPSVTKQPRPGIVARDGTRDDGQRERDDGKSPDFEVNLGKVISTLREDYPRILDEPPEFDIFTDEIELRDPTGVAFRGISNYKRVFATLRFFRQTFMNDATTTFRLTYDWSKQQVRVSWNMVLQLKARQRPIYVDGISAYHINSNGLAYRHELETVVVNGRAVEPPFAYAWINLPAWVSRGSAGKATAGAALPTPHANAAAGGPAVAGAAQQQQFAYSQAELELAGGDMGVGALLGAARTDPELRGDYMKTLSTVLMMDADGAESGGGGDGAGGSDTDTAVEEAAAAAAKKEKNRRAAAKKEKKKGGWFGSNGPELACETSWDCTGGMVCCDFVLLKVCCSNGIRQPKFGELIPSLVPIPGRGRNENDAPKRTPPGGNQRAPQRPGSW